MLSKIKNKIYNTLRWSEKYTKTDMIYLSKGGFWLSFGQIISSISSFLLAIAFANLLPKETYGNYKYILSIISILTIPTLSGMNASLTRAISRNFEGSIIPALQTKIKYGVIGSFFSCILAIYYLINTNYLLATSLLIAAIFIPFMDSFAIYKSYFTGKKEFKLLTKYNNINQIISFLTIIIVLFLSKNIIIILFSYFAVHTITRFISLKLCLNKIKNKNEDPQVIKYGLQLSLIKGLTSIAGSINNIFIFHFLGSGSLAIFSMAIAPTEQIRSQMVNLENLLLPKLSQDNWEIPSLKNILKKIFPFILLLILIIITFIFLAPFFYKIFFSQYMEAVIFSQFFAPTLIITFINIFLNDVLLSKKRVREQKILAILNISSNFLITIPMIYYFQINGLIVSIYINKIIEMTTLLYLLFIQKKHITQ